MSIIRKANVLVVALGVLDGVLQFRHESGVVEQSCKPILVDHLPYAPATFGSRNDDLQQQVEALGSIGLVEEIVRSCSERFDVIR